MRAAIATMVFLFMAIKGYCQCADSTVVLFEADFELDGGGLLPDTLGDWEYGEIPAYLSDSICTGPFTSPPGAYSGSNGWGTLLGHCYRNSGAESTLSLTVDLSQPGFSSAELRFWQWHEVFVYYDFMEVRANGAVVYKNDSLMLSSDWQEIVVDMDAYVGAVVNIEFSLYATVVVNRAGWYLDDLQVSACFTDPSSVQEVKRQRMQLYPNPAVEELFIAGELPTQGLLEIISTSGKVVISTAIQDGEVNSLNVSGIPAGLYLLRITSKEGLFQTTFIKG